MARDLAAPARGARTHEPPRGVGRDGAPGGARDQEPADADSAQCRAPPARERRSRRAAQPGARTVGRDDPHAGEAAATDRVGVFELRVLARPRSRRRWTSRRCCTRSSIRIAARSTGQIHFDVDVPSNLPPVHVDRTLIARALTNIVENALHAMGSRGTLTIVAHARG